MEKIKAEEWVRNTFADDVISSEESGLDEDYIVLKPNMEAGSWLLILEYYTGVRHVNTSPKGTGCGQMVRISNFLDIFSDMIDGDKSTGENLNKLLEYSEEEKLGYSWYFRLYLDKNQYENFVDVREIFADLYANFSMPKDAEETDRSIMLQAILTANRRFKAFMEKKECTEGEKEFFSL